MERVFSNKSGSAFLDIGIFTDEDLLTKCIEEIDSKLEDNPEIILYGNVCKQHRSVGFFSNESIGYKYSGKLMISQPLFEHLNILLNTINSMIGSNFNGILINKYNDGGDYIGAHSDDESNLDQICVVSISYGAERIFRIRDKLKNIVHEEKTKHCGILHMGGNFQSIYTHEIPKQMKVKETRISFTFRKHLK